MCLELSDLQWRCLEIADDSKGGLVFDQALLQTWFEESTDWTEDMDSTTSANSQEKISSRLGDGTRRKQSRFRKVPHAARVAFRRALSRLENHGLIKRQNYPIAPVERIYDVRLAIETSYEGYGLTDDGRKLVDQKRNR